MPNQVAFKIKLKALVSNFVRLVYRALVTYVYSTGKLIGSYIVLNKRVK